MRPLQTDALLAAGAERVFADKISGSRRARPELDRMLEQLRDGDVVTVTYLQRIGESFGCIDGPRKPVFPFSSSLRIQLEGCCPVPRRAVAGEECCRCANAAMTERRPERLFLRFGNGITYVIKAPRLDPA
ncbi:MAG: recombinase family protein [Pseudomonadota bacterium]